MPCIYPPSGDAVCIARRYFSGQKGKKGNGGRDCLNDSIDSISRRLAYRSRMGTVVCCALMCSWYIKSLSCFLLHNASYSRFVTITVHSFLHKHIHYTYSLVSLHVSYPMNGCFLFGTLCGKPHLAFEVFDDPVSHPPDSVSFLRSPVTG